MVQFPITVHKMLNDSFFENCKSRLGFSIGRHHIPQAAIMRKTSSVFPRKSSEVFGNLRKIVKKVVISMCI